jgi:hypothetical protein
MKHNVSILDGAIRWVLAAMFLTASLTLPGQSLLALLAAVVGLVLIATALQRTCPIYSLLGISTCRREPAPRHH